MTAQYTAELLAAAARAAMVGIALTAAKAAGPVAARRTRTLTGGYTAVLLAVAAAIAALAVARAGAAPRPAPTGAS
jgi:hypothetical protein